MTREQFLTARWNNVLTLGLGLPALIYVVGVLSTSALSDHAAFIGVVIIGVVYWIIVEQHAAMRFARLRESSANDMPAKPGFPNQLILVVYNVVWWIPIVLAFAKVIDYNTGFITFALITAVRAIANLYRINVLAPEQAQYFPFRTP